MDWLTNWDDLIHGTAVFSAAVPFLLALILGTKTPIRFWWLVVPLAVAGSFYWLFGMPKFPPQGSDHVAMSGLIAAALLISLEFCFSLKWQISVVLRLLLFGAIAWSVYPAWLADDSGMSQKLLICSGMGACIAGWAAIVEVLSPSNEMLKRNLKISPAALIPPTIALAILLQLGGAARFGQAAGALAAALGALCLLLIFKMKKTTGAGKTVAFWGLIYALLGWSGWLFAELRYGLACLLLLAPFAGLVVNLIPLPRKNTFLDMFWDGMASATLSGTIAWIAVSDYTAEMSEFEGY